VTLLPMGHKSGMFFDAPAHDVGECLAKWGNEVAVSRFTVAKRVTLTLKEAFDFVAERDFNPTRAFVIEFNKSRCAFFDNHSEEFIACAELFNVCRFLRTQGYFFRYDDIEGSPHNGSAQFCAYRFVDGAVKERQVILYKENSWVFAQSGTPLPFEQVDAYALPKKRNRLSSDILRNYGEVLKLPFWDEASYGKDVVLLHWGDQPVDDQSTLKSLMSVFGRPSFIMDRHGIRPPPK
jgi:hypothetical protein